MRSPMRNCLKYVQQCQNGFFKKTCFATTVPYSVMWIPLDNRPMYTLEVWGIPIISDVEKYVLRPIYSVNLKNRYVNVCINL